MSLHPTEKFAVLLQKGDAVALSSAVEASRQELEAAGETRFLNYWRGRAALLRDDPDAALQVAQGTDDTALRTHLQILAHRARAEAGGSPSPLLELLANEYEASGKATLLFDLCEAHLRFGDAKFAADHYEELLRRVPTVAALNLAVQALVNTNQLVPLVQLLERSGDFFPSGDIPIELQRLKRDSQQRLGYVAAAREQAENVAAVSGKPEDIFRVVQLHRETADFAKASVAARQVLSHPAAAPEHLIATAQAVLAHDSNLSRQLLDKALTADNLAPSVGAAGYFLAHMLDHQEAARRLAPKMVEASRVEGSGVTAFTDEQIISLLRERGAHAGDVQTEYARGRAPLHFLLELVGGSFPVAFQQTFHPLGRGASTWLSRPIFFARHGGRSLEEEPQRFKRLLVDITGLLVADELSLLDLIEESFAPVLVPPSLVPLLTEFLDNNPSHSVRRRDGHEQILRLFDDGLLQSAPLGDPIPSVPALSQLSAERQQSLSLAEKSDGFVVDFHPITEGIPRVLVELPAEWQRRFVTCASIVAALFAMGRITANERDRALLRLPTEPDEPRPPSGASLYVDDGPLRLLADSGVLVAMCSAFKVFVDGGVIQGIRAELSAGTVLESTRARVRALVDRIRSGFESAKWQVAALQTPVSESIRGGLATRCIHELLLVQQMETGSVAWIDDRLLNAHVSIGQLPIVTTLGVLAELRRNEKLSEADFFSRLHTLRAAEVRYVPVTAEELLWNLRRAPVVQDAIVEIPELAALRRYISLCLLDRDRLQAPNAEAIANRTLGEINFLISAHSACVEALRKLWSDPKVELRERTARADWLLDEVWFDTISLPSLLGLILPNTARLNSYGAALSQLYTIGLLPEESVSVDDTSARSREFFEWLRQRTTQDRDTLRQLGTWLKTFFDPRPLAKGKSRRFRAGIYKFLQTRYFFLPFEIRRSFALEDWQANRLGIGKEQFVTVGPYDFRIDEFAAALARVINGREASIRPHLAQQVFRLSFDPKHEPAAVVLRPETGGQAFQSSDDLFHVLSPSVRERERVLRAHRGWFERSADPLATIQRVARVPHIGRRLLKVMEHRNASAENHYEQLQKKLRDPGSLDIRDFKPPRLVAVVRHLRLTPSSRRSLTSDDYGVAAGELLAAVGLTETLCRLCTLPVRLPENLRDHVCSLSTIRRERLMSRLDDELVSPVGRLHLFGLYLALGSTEEAIGIARELVSSEGKARFDAFHSLLNWCGVQFGLQPGIHSDDDAKFLVALWHHAARLQHSLAKINSHEYMATFFTEHLQLPPAVAFQATDRGGSDALHPRVYSRVRHVMLGIAANLPAHWTVDDVPEELRDIANEQATEDYGGVRAPNLFLLQASGRHPNVTSSYLGTDRTEALAPLIGVQAELFSGARVMKEATAALDAIREDPNAAAAWMLFSALFAHTTVTAELRPQFEEALQRVSFKELAKLENAVRKALLAYLCGHAGTDASRDKIRGEILELAKVFADASTESGTSDASVQLIVECAHQWSVAGRHRSTASFASLLSDILDVWPAAATESWTMLRRFALRLPLSQQTGMWPAILKLRTLVWRVPAR